MNTLQETIDLFVQQHDVLPANSRILVACSGGVDSMVLLHYLARQRDKYALTIGAAHVDHMLRGQASREDGQLVEKFCRQLEIPFYSGQIPVPEIVQATGGNVQAVCREERYRFFADIMQAQAFDCLATGHHADDQLETVLMQLTKGNPPLGMPVKREMSNGKLLTRPFLTTPKSALYAYAKAYQVKFREDPSNEADAYMRNRFRHKMLPSMLAENPALLETITPMTARLQADERLLQQLTKDHLQSIVTYTKEGLPVLTVKAFQELPVALQRRAVLLLLNYLYRPDHDAGTIKDELLMLLMQHMSEEVGNVTIDLPNGFQFHRSYEQISFERKETKSRNPKTLLQGKINRWGEQAWFYWEAIERVDEKVLANAKSMAFFNLSTRELPLKVRTWQHGDRIHLTGMTSSKRLSRLFIDEKVNKQVRAQLPVVTTQENLVCAVPGVRYGKYFTRQQTEESKYIFIHGTN